ncbi:MAG: T9SS type A sorting domain-containing protein [Bacteroidota bacterium]
MKKNIYFFLLLFPSVGFAQQWKPIASGEKFNYKADTATYISNVISVDSTDVVGGDSVFYLNRVVTDCPGFSGVDKKLYNQPQFLQKMMIQKPGGVYCFSGPHKYWINTLAEPGESWVYDSLTLINAQVTSKTYELVLSQMDSVKSITLTGGQIIKLSKNFGIILFTSLDNGLIYSLEGIKGRNIGTLIPGFFEVFNFNVGDVFQYHNYEMGELGDGSESYRKQVILAKDSTVSGYEYTVKIIEKFWGLTSFWYPYGFTHSCVTDTLVFSDSSKHFCNLSPFEIVRNPVFTANASICKIFPDTGNTVSRLIGIDMTFNPDESSLYTYGLGDTLLRWGGNFYKKYSTTLGKVIDDISFFYRELEELIGYVKNGDTTGYIYTDSYLLGIEAPEFLEKQISISPNPATTSITLQMPQLESDAEVCVFNSLGEQVLKTKLHKAKSEVRIDVAKLPAGLYFVKMNNYSGKFVKQN